ncbi:DUF6088 family protein [Methylobacterium sp. J-001]|uniref:DUF6088 family protein n=1 Tax=Methylobacterium sp. J-001 TaxID=2836609 RepID=UPI001FBB97A7|nr:DUF6088 family protein [Methylobacterium sp. J-001]MCJ2117056.1 DUF6088 family protein [Methylobacterium sp. J-001]
MTTVSQAILSATAEMPEGALITAKAFLCLGQRAAVDQALSRLARRGQLLRAGRGLYVRPVTSRFGTRAPSVERVVEAVAESRSETVALQGAAAANHLGLTTQVPMRSVYLTSGPSRTLKVGKQVVELRHAARWKLALAGRPAGEAVRALAWAGPEKAKAALIRIREHLPPTEVEALRGVAAMLPAWLAEHVSALKVHA